MTDQVVVQQDTKNPLLNGDSPNQEHCSLDRTTLAALGGSIHGQILIRRAADRLALYTVAVENDAPAGVVRVGSKGLARLGPELPGCLGSIFRSTVADFGATLVRDFTMKISEAEARDRTALIEQVLGTGTALAVLAPHGGVIEEGTDKQAELVHQSLAGVGKSVRTWLCQGWKKGGGAEDCWHITSTDISPASFPKLGKMAETKFQHAVSFHGWSKALARPGAEAVDIGIGGGTVDQSEFPREHLEREALKSEIATQIRNAIKATGSKLVVSVLRPSEKFSGTEAKNIVNRITARGNGIQIEQVPIARTDIAIRDAIALAVAMVYGQKI